MWLTTVKLLRCAALGFNREHWLGAPLEARLAAELTAKLQASGKIEQGLHLVSAAVRAASGRPRAAHGAFGPPRASRAATSGMPRVVHAPESARQW